MEHATRVCASNEAHVLDYVARASGPYHAAVTDRYYRKTLFQYCITLNGTKAVYLGEEE
jgi:hypothetical protein